MKKKYWIAILCAVRALTAVALLPVTLHTAVAEGETSGQFGNNLYWSFDESTGTLTIEGTGSMPDFGGIGSVMGDAHITNRPWEAFRESIVKIVIDDGVSNIGNCAFGGIPGSYDSIVYSGILSYPMLREISIPESIETIGSGAFYGCANVEAIKIPHNVMNIGMSAFDSCQGLTEIEIPDLVTTISNRAFCGCTGLRSVIFGKSVTRIGKSAFYGCTSLQTIMIPDNVTSIDSHAFSHCTGLQSITIPDGVTVIGWSAFSHCTGLQSITIPDSVTSIGAEAFSDCTGMTSVTLPCSALLSYSSNSNGSTPDSFKNCTAITRIHYTKGSGRMPTNNCYNSPWGAARNNSLIITLDEGIQNIRRGEFAGCIGLTSITIPTSVTSIYARAFSNTGLMSITIPDSVTSIGEYAFSGCTGISEITIPDSVTSIGRYAFSKCTGLTTITIPDGVTSIVEYVFSECTGLTTITIPAKELKIYSQAFYVCSALTDVYYNGTREERVAKLTIYNEYNGNSYLVNAYWHYRSGEVCGIIEWNSEDVQFKGKTPYVIANGSAQTPSFSIMNSLDEKPIDPSNYDYEYKENINAGTGYVFIKFKNGYYGDFYGIFKIYLQPTTTTTIENVSNGIKLTWSPVPGAAGYVIYRRAWSSTTDGWTTFERWNNTTGTTYIDGADDSHKVYAGTRYQYGVKAYFARRVDPVTGATIGGNVGDNFNLGEVGPLKTTVRITTRVLNSVTAGSRQMTVKWTPSRNFTGYQIKYATDANFTKNVKAIKITDWSTAEKIITGLTRGTTYYVTIRSYHEFNGMTYFGEWSNVKSCRVR